MEVEIGKSIKKLRVQHGMTLRELGEKSNLSIMESIILCLSIT